MFSMIASPPQPGQSRKSVADASPAGTGAVVLDRSDLQWCVNTTKAKTGERWICPVAADPVLAQQQWLRNAP